MTPSDINTIMNHFKPSMQGQISDIPWNLSNAMMVVEGLDGEEHSPAIVLEAWGFIGQNCNPAAMQGFYGRSLQRMLDEGLLDENFVPQWDELDEYISYKNMDGY